MRVAGTSALKQAILDARSNMSLELKTCIDANSYTLSALREARVALGSARLRNVLNGGMLLFEKAKATPSKELLERRKFLRERQEQRDYHRMAMGSPLRLQRAKRSSSIRQIAVGFNVLILPISLFVAVDFLGNSMSWPATSRYALGLLCAIAMLIVETVLFIIRASRAEYMNAKFEQDAPRLIFARGSGKKKLD